MLCDQLIAIFERIIQGKQTKTDLQVLKNNLKPLDNRNFIQIAKFKLNIGQDDNIQLEDNIVYQGSDAESIKNTLKEILFSAIFERILQGKQTKIDLQILKDNLKQDDEKDLVQIGKFNINIGQGENIKIGDDIVYQGPDAEAIRKCVKEALGENVFPRRVLVALLVLAPFTPFFPYLLDYVWQIFHRENNPYLPEDCPQYDFLENDPRFKKVNIEIQYLDNRAYKKNRQKSCSYVFTEAVLYEPKFPSKKEVKVPIEMVYIPQGDFQIGTLKDELGRELSEEPQYSVRIKQFLIGKYPITKSQWQAVKALPRVDIELGRIFSRGDDYAVEKVSWVEAVEFCKRLSSYTNRNYRLPTESEWEYACRAGTKTRFYLGDRVKTDFKLGDRVKAQYINFNESLKPVTSYPKSLNKFGLNHMHGNVWEWCQDHWHSDYNGAPKDGSPWFDSNGYLRVIRGGSYRSSVQEKCRSGQRDRLAPSIKALGYGFRIVCEINIWK